MLALCSYGTMPYVGFVSWCDLLSLDIVSWWDHTLCWHCVLRGPCLMLDLFRGVTYFILALCPGVTYFLSALCPGGTIPYLGIVSWWDHTLRWHGVLMGPYLMLAWCSDVTHFPLALCPGVTYFIWTLCPYPN